MSEDNHPFSEADEIPKDRGVGYTTPPQRDEQRVPYPSEYTEEEVEELKRRGIYFINWNGWIFTCGPGFSHKFYDEVAKTNASSDQRL